MKIVGMGEQTEPQNNNKEINEASPKKQKLSEVMTAASRCLALEQAYVHDVYAEIARECGACSPVRSHIKEFLFEEFEFGSLLMDVGCGDGKYLNLNSNVFTVGMEKCEDWFGKENNIIHNNYTNASSRNDLLFADLVHMPIRDEFFDGVLCCGVLHHLSTTERRIRALTEMCRILKIGGKLLITVWAFEGRELGSQDVLIKWNTSQPKPSNNIINNSDSSASSETDDDTTSSCSTNLANYVNRKAAYESCNSPTSEFGTCYSFVRRALQKFNFSPTFYHASRRTSKCSIAKETTSTSGFATLDEVPIELRNIEDELEGVKSPLLNCNNDFTKNNINASKLNSNTGFENFNSRRSSKDSIKDHYGSLLSLIKEHILPKQPKIKVQNLSRKNEKPSKGIKLNGFLSQQRFSLPTINLRRRSERIQMSFDERKRSKENSIEREMEYKTIELLRKGATEQAKKLCDIVSDKEEFFSKNLQTNCKKKRELWGKILQKSLSSDSLESKYSKQSRQQSTGTETATSTSTSEGSTKLLAYYSMPELRLLSSCSTEEQSNGRLRFVRNKPKLTDLHPITFLKSDSRHIEVKRNDSQDTQNAIEEMEQLPSIGAEEVEKKEFEENREKAIRLKEKLQLHFPMQQVLTKITEEEKEDLQDCKKSRSLSVEYKSQTSPNGRPQFRRFSVSPSMLVSRTIVQFVHQENQHETHPSVDSEESFVTIIPANRSCRGSVDVSNDENESFIDDVMMDFEHQSPVSTTEEDALCENLSNQQESDDNTSASTATTKSIESLSSKTQTESKASTPSPPANLHRYFHLFRCGEVEELIEKNIDNLHVVKSYYSEHATSWCVVAEKVQVWTI